jgi:ABC transport system ATP-binding/permease protein
MFLKLQLSQDKIEEYIALYDGFVGVDEGKEKKALVSVKDSVKTLAICKKINKTLTQKQKAVVLVRLYEFIRVDNSLSIYVPNY